jgi:general secretion pathway protein D
VRHLDVVNWLRTLFGERVRAQEDPTRNAVLISGTPDNVQAALEAIRMLDQPVLVGGQSLSISPVHGSADDLARRLTDVLSAQGYAVQPQGAPAGSGIRNPIVILPVPSINAVYVFARGEDVVKHISDLARSLDKPNERGVGKNFFTYAVKHKDAAVLAETLQQLLGGTAARPGVPGVAPVTRIGVVIDKSTNTLIFQASQEEYAQTIALLQTLDRPAKAALIEVTVAELSVDDSTKLGVEWTFSDGNGSGGTLGGLGLGTAGLNYRVLNAAGGVRAALNALAVSNRATILSSPRVMARNGETATIQVGQEVPIVTSQQSTGTGAIAGTSQVLQTIQYRNTGVILKVKPVIHSGDQIDLDVTQEVSSAQSTNTGVSASPTFSTRKIDTKLTLRNGATVLLGGLISEDNSRGNTGVPFLKDIPVLGNLFSNQAAGSGRRELVILITPYLINDNHEAEAVTEAFRRMLGPWAAPVVVPKPAPVVEPIGPVAPRAPATAAPQ